MTADVVIRGGTIVDGTGSPGRPGALAIAEDRLGVLFDAAEIDAATAAAGRVIDARGKLSPVVWGTIQRH